MLEHGVANAAGNLAGQAINHRGFDAPSFLLSVGVGIFFGRIRGVGRAAKQVGEFRVDAFGAMLETITQRFTIKRLPKQPI